jgi:hypothetical protein
MPADLEYEEKIVVNATLIAGAMYVNGILLPIPIDSIRVHTSSRIDEPFDARSNALSGALVVLSSSTFRDTLVEYENAPGVYHPPVLRFAQEGETYVLEVSDGFHPDVIARTTVPAAVRMVRDSVHTDTGLIAGFPDTIVYRPAGPEDDFMNPVIFSFEVEYDSTAPPYLLRLVNIALEPSEENMILEDDSLKAFIYKWNGLDDDEEGMQLRILQKAATSFNSTIFDRRYEVSWSALTFYGPQVFMVLALDEQYYNYHKGFLEGPPRNINYLPESNVEGGYGLFASASLAPENVHFYFLQRPGE